MTEIYGSNPTADHKYFVIWKNNSATLKTGHGTEPAARHHARLIIKNDVGTVLEGSRTERTCFELGDRGRTATTPARRLVTDQPCRWCIMTATHYADSAWIMQESK